MEQAELIEQLVTKLKDVAGINETSFISDKRLYRDEPRFTLKPTHFTERIANILGNIGNNQQKLEETLQTAHSLPQEMTALAGDQYRARFQLSI